MSTYGGLTDHPSHPAARRVFKNNQRVYTNKFFKYKQPFANHYLYRLNQFRQKLAMSLIHNEYLITEEEATRSSKRRKRGRNRILHELYTNYLARHCTQKNLKVQNGTLPPQPDTNNMFANTLDALSKHVTFADAIQVIGCANHVFHFILCVKLRVKAEVIEVNASIFCF